MAEVAALLEADEIPDTVLHRLTRLGVELVSGDRTPVDFLLRLS